MNISIAFTMIYCLFYLGAVKYLLVFNWDLGEWFLIENLIR